MSDRFSPFIGDRYLVNQNVSSQKYRLWHLMQSSLDHPDSDIRIIFSGAEPLFLLQSQKAFEQFLKMVPNKIDRHAHHLKHFGRIAEGAIDQLKSNDDWRTRRKAVLNALKLNTISLYTPLVIQIFDDLTASWKVGQEVNLTKEFTNLTFHIISMILFGKNVQSKIGLMEYNRPNGTKTHLHLVEYFHELIEDLESTSFKSINKLIPWLQKYNLTSEHKYLEKNIQILWHCLDTYLSSSSETEDEIQC